MKICINGKLEHIKSFVEYDESSPTFLKWIKKPSKRVNIGSMAGSKCCDGYMRLTLHRNSYAIGRIVYAMFNGYISPDMDIDHIDSNKSNNCIHNLRLVSHAVNQRNRKVRRNNTSGISGVFFDEKNQRWRATWRSIDGKWKSKSFNISVHGSLSYEMAIHHRENAILKLNEASANYSIKHISMKELTCRL